MKLSISLPESEVAYLDELARVGEFPSRSAAVAHALQLMRTRSLADDYAAAWQQWPDDDDDAWESTVADELAR